MDELIKNLGAFWGPAGVICAIQFAAIAYLYKRVEASQKEVNETLKLVIPLTHKMTSTLDVTLPVLMAKIGGDR